MSTPHHRTLPHLTKGTPSPEARGFFFFHVATGREGLIDTTVKPASATSSAPPPIPVGIEDASAKIISASSLQGYSSMEHVHTLSSKVKMFTFVSLAIW
ncbi:hypothetical protein BKA82DRAFT_4351992 [Pisolithus tinctorius]|nr:hypothetical protein BKA82DRAFT_4351992 [Pisolithus tinctorius]